MNGRSVSKRRTGRKSNATIAKQWATRGIVAPKQKLKQRLQRIRMMVAVQVRPAMQEVNLGMVEAMDAQRGKLEAPTSFLGLTTRVGREKASLRGLNKRSQAEESVNLYERQVLHLYNERLGIGLG